MSKKSFMNKIKSFTLIELLVVITIIGLLISIIFVVMNDAREKGKIARAEADLNSMSKAIMLYASNNNGIFPPNGQPVHCCDGLSMPGVACTSDGVYCGGLNSKLITPLKPYAALSLKDPWGTCYLYHYHPNSSQCNYVMSLGPDKTFTWQPEFEDCICKDDDICLFFGKGTQTF